MYCLIERRRVYRYVYLNAALTTNYRERARESLNMKSKPDYWWWVSDIRVIGIMHKLCEQTQYMLREESVRKYRRLKICLFNLNY